MRINILILINTLLFLSCSTKMMEMKKSEKREDLGLLIINEEMNSSWFYGVKNNKIVYEISSIIEDDRHLYSYEKISTPITSLKKIRICQEYDSLHYVWVKIEYQAIKDFKVLPFKGHTKFHKYKVYYYDDVKVDSIEVLDKNKNKEYHRVLDSLIQINAPNILYGD